MTLVFGHFQEFWARLPDLGQLADFRNVGWLMLAIAVVKILHELGHAVACKHFGGEVHELGLLLLAFTPCLYCDVSDAWQLPDRRQRILISAAGMNRRVCTRSLGGNRLVVQSPRNSSSDRTQYRVGLYGQHACD